MNFTYDLSVFDVPDEQAAKDIILTPEAGLSPNERWEQETAWLMPRLEFPKDGVVLDYGCGIGRIAKQIESHPVVGVDVAPPMRGLAIKYVEREDFAVISPSMFYYLGNNGLTFAGGVAIWALQHIRNMPLIVRLIHQFLASGAPFYTVDRFHRAIPAKDETGQFNWVDDGLVVERELRALFEIELQEPVPTSLCTEGAFFRRWRKPA